MLAQEKQQGLPMGLQTQVSHQGAHSVYSKSPLTRETEHEPGHVCDKKTVVKKHERRDMKIFFPDVVLYCRL